MTMPRMGWRETLIDCPTDGPALSNSAAQTSIFPAAAKGAFDANYLQPGQNYTLEVDGRASNKNPTPGNLTLEVKLGSIVVMTTGAFALNTAGAKTNVSWNLRWNFRVRAIGNGTAANLFHIPRFESQVVDGSGTGILAGVFMPNTPGVGAGFNSTDTAAGALLLDLFATFQTADVNNNIQVHAMALYRNNSY